MSRDDIIRMARNCFDVHTDERGRETFSGDLYCVEELVALVTKAEREACAQVAERWDDDVETHTKPSDAIRARGRHEPR